MNEPITDSTSTPEPIVPEGLASDLRVRQSVRVSIPPEVDDAILAMARQRLVRRRLIPLSVRCVATAVAAAAMVLAAVIMWPGGRPTVPAPVPALSAATEDIDGSGRVDILDAFALARHIEAGEGARVEWDVTGDGGVTRDDVDSIALAAVSLQRGAL